MRPAVVFACQAIWMCAFCAGGTNILCIAVFAGFGWLGLAVYAPARVRNWSFECAKWEMKGHTLLTWKIAALFRKVEYTLRRRWRQQWRRQHKKPALIFRIRSWQFEYFFDYIYLMMREWWLRCQVRGMNNPATAINIYIFAHHEHTKTQSRTPARTDRTRTGAPNHIIHHTNTTHTCKPSN